MDFPDLNWLAVAVAAVVPMVLGALWYSPVLFANVWMRAMGLDPADKALMERLKKEAPPAYLGSLAGAIVQAFVLALVVGWADARTALDGLIVGLLCWLGFTATVLLSLSLFENRDLKLFWISNGYQVLSAVSMGMLLALWQ